MEIQFRKAKLEDIPQIIKLCNECFLEKTDIEEAKRVFLKTKDNQNEIYLVGVLNDEIIAHAKITIINTIYESIGTYSILNHICVRNDLRRKNIGTQLLQECERISKENQCNCMELWSKNFRKPAHACYKKYGFVLEDAGFFKKEI